MLYFRRVGLAIDRAFNALFGGPDDQTLSQTLGFALIRREWIGLTFAPVVDFLNRIATGERNHCIASLYKDDGSPIFPDRMP